MIKPSEVIALGVALTVVDIAVVALRFHVKRTIVKSVVLNDYLILLSLACACGTAVSIVYGAFAQGFGKVSPPAVTHNGINADSSHEIAVTRHIAWSFMCISTWTYGLAKLSVLLFYRSIFVGRTFNIISKALIVLVCVWTLTTFCFLFFQCGSQIDGTWTNAAYIAQHCLSGFAIGTSAAATDVFTDLTILILPLHWVLKLHIPLKKRLSVIGVFLFGAFAIISSIIRLIGVSLVYPTHNKSPNQYAFLTTLVYYGQLEAGLCIIAACLPTLGPLIFPNRSQSRARGRNSSSSASIRWPWSKSISTLRTATKAEQQTFWAEVTPTVSETRKYVGRETPITSRTLDNEDHISEQERHDIFHAPPAELELD